MLYAFTPVSAIGGSRKSLGGPHTTRIFDDLTFKAPTSNSSAQSDKHFYKFLLPSPNTAIMAPSFDNLPEEDNYDDDEEIDFSGTAKRVTKVVRKTD